MLLLALLAPDPAQACSPPPCSGGYVVPGDGATVPANLAGAQWRPRIGSHDDFSEPALTGPGGAVPLTAEVADDRAGEQLLRPPGPLAPGAHTLTVPVNCEYTYGDVGQNRGTFGWTVSAPAPEPTALGALRVEPLGMGVVTISTGGGSCDLDVQADRFAVRLDLDPSAAPWADALLYETWVDGQRWWPVASLGDEVPTGGSWVGRGEDLVFVACTDADWADAPLKEGEHTVQMRARLPGGEVVWQTAEVGFSLKCGAPVAPSEEGGACGGCNGGAAIGGGWLLALVGLRSRDRLG